MNLYIYSYEEYWFVIFFLFVFCKVLVLGFFDFIMGVGIILVKMILEKEF